jgi:hypothetical protein
MPLGSLISLLMVGCLACQSTPCLFKRRPGQTGAEKGAGKLWPEHLGPHCQPPNFPSRMLADVRRSNDQFIPITESVTPKVNATELLAPLCNRSQPSRLARHNDDDSNPC